MRLVFFLKLSSGRVSSIDKLTIQTVLNALDDPELQSSPLSHRFGVVINQIPQHELHQLDSPKYPLLSKDVIIDHLFSNCRHRTGHVLWLPYDHRIGEAIMTGRPALPSVQSSQEVLDFVLSTPELHYRTEDVKTLETEESKWAKIESQMSNEIKDLNKRLEELQRTSEQKFQEEMDRMRRAREEDQKASSRARKRDNSFVASARRAVSNAGRAFVSFITGNWW